MAMSYEFISGGIVRPLKRRLLWPRLSEKREYTYCGEPHSYVDCGNYKVKPAIANIKG